MKSITLYLIYFCSFGIYAQECIPKNLLPEVEIKATNLSIDNNKTSKELESLQNSIKNSEPRNSYTLGVNATRHTFNIAYSYKLESFKQCTVLEKLKIIIAINPVIYIANETQQYACTKQRVYDHEMNHYKINMRAINRTMSYIRDPLLKKYNIVFYGYSKQDFESESYKLTQKIQKDIADFYISESEPYHKALDTPENYSAESNLCSMAERYAVQQLMRVSK